MNSGRVKKSDYFIKDLGEGQYEITQRTMDAGIGLGSKKVLRNYKSKIVLNFVIICSLGVFLMILLSKIYTPDAGMYHIPYINILNENKIITGLSNLHHRYGHISIMQYLIASFGKVGSCFILVNLSS